RRTRRRRSELARLVARRGKPIVERGQHHRHLVERTRGAIRTQLGAREVLLRQQGRVDARTAEARRGGGDRRVGTFARRGFVAGSKTQTTRHRRNQNVPPLALSQSLAARDVGRSQLGYGQRQRNRGILRQAVRQTTEATITARRKS